MTNRVLTASPVELVTILYQSGIQAVDEAVLALQSGDILARGNAVSKAVEIVSELQASLRADVQPEYSKRLSELYAYMQQQLLRAHREKSEKGLMEVSRLLNTLFDGWAGGPMSASVGRDRTESGESAQDCEYATVSSPYSAEPARLSSDRCWQF